MNRSNKQSLSFAKGLLFVGVAYIVIKLIDQYELFFSGLSGMISTLSPFLLAFVIAYVFNPVMMFFETRFKFKRGLSITMTYCSFLILCYVGISFLFPAVYQSAKDLILQLPNYASEVEVWLNNWVSQLNSFDFDQIASIQDQILSFVPKLTELLTSSVSSIVSLTYSAVTITGNVLMAFIISIYVLLEKEKFISITKKTVCIVCRPKYAEHVFHTANLFHSNIGKYLIGKSIDSLFVGVCAIIGLSLIGAKYAVLLGVIFGVTNMVPFIGPIFGTAIAAGINLFYSPLVALIALVFLLIVQQVETLIIDPKVVGEKMGLNPFFTLLAVTIGGKFMGIVGMILGVPVMGIIKIYLTHFINHEYTKLYPTIKKVVKEK